MSTIRSFRDLVAWQLGMKLAQGVYEITQFMPKDEMFGLTSQMRRAAVSMPSNIAEGYGRGTTKDYLKHLRIARGSLAELSTQLELAAELGFVKQDDLVVVWRTLEETGKVLQGLIQSITSRDRT